MFPVLICKWNTLFLNWSFRAALFRVPICKRDTLCKLVNYDCFVPSSYQFCKRNTLFPNWPFRAISASCVPSSRLLHSAIPVSIPISQGLINASLACSFCCCFLCAWIRSSLLSMACHSIRSRVNGSGSSGSITRRFICDSLATPKSTRN